MKKHLLFIFAGILCFTNSFILSEGLVAYYSFSGNANDSSGYGNHGVVDGAALSQDRFGNDNSAYYLDGNGDIITIADSPNLDLTDAMTMSFWLKPASYVSGYGNIISKGDPPLHSNQAPWQLTLNSSGTLDVYRLQNNNYSATYGITTLPLNQWTHLAITFDKTQGKVTVYKNGTFVTDWSKTTSIFVDDVDITIGSQTWNNHGYQGSYNYNGYFDELRIYDQALSQTEISTVMNMEAVPEPISVIMIAFGMLFVFYGRKLRF